MEETHSDNDDEKGSDAEYRVSEGEGNDSAGSDAEEDSDSEDDIDAKIAAYAATLQSQKDNVKRPGFDRVSFSLEETFDDSAASADLGSEGGSPPSTRVVASRPDFV
jgi:hypothetical protein